MQRILGAIAIFAGWLSIGVSGVAGLAYSEFFGLSHVEGTVRPSAVYGVSGLVILWVIVATALLTSVPMASAVAAVDPRRTIRLIAGVMFIAGIALLPDELGRVFGLPLAVGAVCLWIGAEMVYRESLASGRVAPVELEPGPAAPAATPPYVSADTITPATAPLALPPIPAPAIGRSGGRRRGGSRRAAQIPEKICPWCSAAIPANVATCPNCQAALDAAAADAIAIPGVTEVPAGLRRYAEKAGAKGSRPSLLGMIFRDDSIRTAVETPPPSDPSALRPPSAELKAEMARLDAEIAAGGRMPVSESTEPVPTAEAATRPDPPATPTDPDQPTG